ncbi:MAG: hypothetical protein Q9160_004111 [Pyrenula sp. 1 TL-2023]
MLTFSPRPGDYLPPSDAEIPGFKTLLSTRLSPTPPSTSSAPSSPETDWNVTDTLATWWRPNFETFMYPFLPGHVTRPKECKKLYFIQLPPRKTLSVPKNMKLLAVPLFELYDNTARYGPQLSAIPHLLSRYRWEFVGEDGKAVGVTPGGGRGDEDKKSEGMKIETKILAGGESEFKAEVKMENEGEEEGQQKIAVEE